MGVDKGAPDRVGLGLLVTVWHPNKISTTYLVAAAVVVVREVQPGLSLSTLWPSATVLPTREGARLTTADQ